MNQILKLNKFNIINNFIKLKFKEFKNKFIINY